MKGLAANVSQKVADFVREVLDKQISNPSLFLNNKHTDLFPLMDTAMWLPIDSVYSKLVSQIDDSISVEKFKQLLALIDSVQVKGEMMRHVTFCAFNLNIIG